MTGERLEVLTVLRRTEQYLRSAGIESPRLDAEVLLGHVLGVPRISLYTGYDRPLTPDELGRYRDLIRRRADRIPVAYLTGVREFYSLEFRVTPDVLVLTLAWELARPVPITARIDPCPLRPRPRAARRPRVVRVDTRSTAHIVF